MLHDVRVVKWQLLNDKIWWKWVRNCLLAHLQLVETSFLTLNFARTVTDKSRCLFFLGGVKNAWPNARLGSTTKRKTIFVRAARKMRADLKISFGNKNLTSSQPEEAKIEGVRTREAAIFNTYRHARALRFSFAGESTGENDT